MPEALAVLAVFVVAIAAWLGAWMHTRNPANYNARDEVARLQQQAAWLEQRLAVAQRERWSPDMVDVLCDEIDQTSEHLARAKRLTLDR